MKKIASGRSHKSDKSKWIGAIKDFKDAIDSSFEIIDMSSSKTQVRSQLFFIFCGVVTVISLIFTFISY